RRRARAPAREPRGPRRVPALPARVRGAARPRRRRGGQASRGVDGHRRASQGLLRPPGHGGCRRLPVGDRPDPGRGGRDAPLEAPGQRIGMKVVSAESRVEVAALSGTGPRAALNLEVVNTSSVIDAVTVEAHGPTAPYVVVSPSPLVLFPEAS